MYTIIIAVVVTVAIYAILSAKKVVKDDVRILFIFEMFGMAIGTIIAAYIPQRYEISKCEVHYILDTTINIQPSSNEITFFTKGYYGELIPMNLKADSLLIEHTNYENSKIEVTSYDITNKFALGKRKVTVNVLMSSNPHQGCGFFEIKKTCGMQVEGVIGRCQKQIILITAYSRNRTLPKSQGTNLYSCKVK